MGFCTPALLLLLLLWPTPLCPVLLLAVSGWPIGSRSSNRPGSFSSTAAPGITAMK
jgi:hypothetical protein